MIDDLHRLSDLEHMLKRMGAVSSVFRIRSEAVGVPGFQAFSELMDAYIELCRRNLQGRTDYAREVLAVDDQARAEMALAFTKIFGQEPAAFFRAPVKAEAK